MPRKKQDEIAQKQEQKKRDSEEVKEIIIERKVGFNYLEVIIIMSISILFGFLIGNLVDFAKDTAISTNVPKDLEEFVTTYNDIIENYYDDVDKKDLLNAAIAGMVGCLDDPYSAYLDGEASKNLKETIDGEYIGIGASLLYQNGKSTIVDIVKNGPADKAGLKNNDILKKVDGEDISSKTLTEISALIKGKKGIRVQLEVLRDNELKEIEVTRETIEISSVTSKIYSQENKKIGYLGVSVFAANTAEQFEENLKKIEKEKIDALIIDVRDNPGGHLTQVSEILSFFLTKKQLMYQLEENGKKKKIYALSNEKRTYPVVILTNESSASASEILASCMKEVYKADIIGMTTYGKGTVQRSITLSNGSMIKYTTQKWFTAKGEWLNEIGVTPTEEVPLNEAFLESGLEEDDNQLQRAIEVLSNK